MRAGPRVAHLYWRAMDGLTLERLMARPAAAQEC
jgi:hypothetical protein